jgi:hypothetical protein
MSYWCAISFKKMEPNQIIPFFKSFKKACNERLELIAQDEFGYCPYIRDNMDLPRSFSEINMDKRLEAADWARDNVFQFKYFYDEQFGLLGVMGVTKALRDLFDGTVEFQNSTDQDYKRKEWCGIPQFEDVFDKWMAAPIDIVKAEYNKPYGDDFDKDYEEYANNPEKLQEKVNYVRRYLCYREIWARYEKYLWEHEEFIHFAVYGPRERCDIIPFIEHCHNAQIKWNDDFEREWKAKHGSDEGNQT